MFITRLNNIRINMKHATGAAIGTIVFGDIRNLLSGSHSFINRARMSLL